MADASSLALVAEKTNAHSRPINSVAYNHDGTRIVSACNGGTIKVWDAGVNSDTRPNLVKSEHFPACYRIPGAQGGEAERAQWLGLLGGLQPRWNKDRLGLG